VVVTAWGSSCSNREHLRTYIKWHSCQPTPQYSHVNHITTDHRKLKNTMGWPLWQNAYQILWNLVNWFKVNSEGDTARMLISYTYFSSIRKESWLKYCLPLIWPALYTTSTDKKIFWKKENHVHCLWDTGKSSLNLSCLPDQSHQDFLPFWNYLKRKVHNTACNLSWT
jgi:hypothetical protein